MESTNPLTVQDIVLVLGAYFYPVNSLSKKKRVMRRGIRKPHGSKVRRYTDFLIGLNNYLASFHGAKLNENIGMTELNEILLNSMPNSWSKQAYVRGFD